MNDNSKARKADLWSRVYLASSSADTDKRIEEANKAVEAMAKVCKLDGAAAAE